MILSTGIPAYTTEKLSSMTERVVKKLREKKCEGVILRIRRKKVYYFDALRAATSP